MTTIKDIAQKAGVSVSTVSRALNNYTDINPKTREKIINLANELNYFANAAAKSLVQKRSHTIGVFFGDQTNSGFDHPFFLEIISAVRQVAGDAGYDLLIFTNLHKQTATYTTLCRERGVDGVFLILTGEGKRKNKDLVELQESGIPCVAIDLPLEGDRCSYVESSNYIGSMKAVRYLLELGHRNIAFIGGDEIGKVSFDRYYGYQAALNEYGVTLDEEIVGQGAYSADITRELTRKIISQRSDVTAFFAVSDAMALTVLDTLKESGYHVPNDVSVVGFDDIKESANRNLTTVRQFKHEMGNKAIQLLLKIIDDPSYKPYPLVVPCELIVRGTTAPLN